MVKSTGSSNYKFAEVNMLLELVEDHLPLGKDEWERLAGMYNANRPRTWADRDYESLRRKFKALYVVRKLTGCPNMPPHISKAKALKREIDDKARTVEMDDEADVDLTGNHEYQQDLSFEYQPADGIWTAREGDEGGCRASSDYSTGGATTVASSSIASSGEGEVEVLAEATVPSTTSTCGGFQELLTMPFTNDGLDGLTVSTGQPVVRCGPTTRSSRKAKSTEASMSPDDKLATSVVTVPKSQKVSKKPAATGFKPGTRDEQEALRYDILLDYATRIGGTELYSFRDEVMPKRKREDAADDAGEASFAKSKRVKAAKAVSALKQKLTNVDQVTHSMGSSMMQMMMIFREENERKAELRREEEERKAGLRREEEERLRREESVVREARRAAEKAESEERRRQDKLEMEERSRRDKEEARARTQELVLLIGALTKQG